MKIHSITSEITHPNTLKSCLLFTWFDQKHGVDNHNNNLQNTVTNDRTVAGYLPVNFQMFLKVLVQNFKHCNGDIK